MLWSKEKKIIYLLLQHFDQGTEILLLPNCHPSIAPPLSFPFYLSPSLIYLQLPLFPMLMNFWSCQSVFCMICKLLDICPVSVLTTFWTVTVPKNELVYWPVPSSVMEKDDKKWVTKWSQDVWSMIGAWSDQ